ncbi:adenylyl cyclase [Streptomyces sp. BV333]|uniref:adenylyl cyclase n=1 Tax=Streptomyces sp. BV333 TaxID=2849673 RepID=UPI001C2E38E0|nr:adenylyl cyclase [Streptomyces sp. BV333]MBV1957671.1 adenylyl cyclase [Streptomyces sp. BV333]
MKREYEVRFLDVDAADIRTRLGRMGAVQRIAWALRTCWIFEGEVLDPGLCLRLCGQGARVSLALGSSCASSVLRGSAAVETVVSDRAASVEILRKLGLRETRYQEHFREEWRLGEAAFSIEAWPDLPVLVAVAGPDEASVQQASALIGFNFGDAQAESVEQIYLSATKRNVLAEPTLLFADTAHARAT